VLERETDLDRSSCRKLASAFPHEVDMTTTAEVTPSTKGMVIRWPFGYDLLVWALTLGRERAFREKQVDLAGLNRETLCSMSAAVRGPRRREGHRAAGTSRGRGA
jgi:hypothetical protein